MTNKQKWSWGVVGVVVLALAVWGFSSLNKKPATTANNTTQQNSTATSNDSGASFSNNKSYNVDVVKYKDARIQFNQACQAVPFNVVYKNGTTIMLDNRASVAHTIKIDSNTYPLGAYNYAIVKLSTSAALPHKILVDCGTQQNVLTILLEK